MRSGIIRLIITIPILLIIFFVSESVFKNASDIITVKSPDTDQIDDSKQEISENDTDITVTEPPLTEQEPTVKEPAEEQPSDNKEPPEEKPVEVPDTQEPEKNIPEIISEQNKLSTYPLPPDHESIKFIDKLIKIAESEPTNPQDDKGRTKYGEAFGAPYAQWCTEFVMWCIKEAENQLGTEYLGSYYPYKDSAYRCVVWYKNKNTFMLKGKFIPRRGDLIFFDYDYDENSDHTGLVTGVEYDEAEDKIYILTIEGNLPEDYPKVIRTRRLAIDEKKIYGYGTFIIEN